MAHLFIFGLGYSAKRIKRALENAGWTVEGSGSDGDLAFGDDEAIRAALGRASHVLSSVPPDGDADPVLERYGDALRHEWLGYLSSSGVYGDTGGAWVDESAPAGGGRRTARALCDAAWLARSARVFRLPGIYGPGRSAFERIAEGRARRIDLPDQVFSRVHVEDLARGVLAGLDAPPGAYNLADDLPASQNAVIEEACRLLGMVPPPLQSLEEAGLSSQARGFYAENRRVANGKARRVLGWEPRFPDYRAGLRDILRRSSP
jgi:nucleoside-diphosphate-sugar epimerase